MITNQPFLISLTKFFDLFQTRSKQKKNKEFNEGMLEKMILILITSILTDLDSADAKRFLDGISRIMYDLLDSISQSKDPLTKLNELKKDLNPDHTQQPFSVSRTYFQEHLPSFSNKRLDEILQKDYIKLMNEKKHIKAKSKDIILAIDVTHEAASTKYKNGELGYIKIGQSKSFRKGLNYLSIYDCTHKLALGFEHIPNFIRNPQKILFNPWLDSLITKIGVVRNTGSNVNLIEGDRGYYDSRLFAASHLKLLQPPNFNRKFVRVIIPRKFTKNKSKNKWEFLLDPSSKQVTKTYMKLKKNRNRILSKKCQELNIPKKGSDYLIPVAQVVLVDEYTNGMNRTLEQVKNEAVRVEKNIKNTEAILSDLEIQYQNELRKFRNSAKVPPYKSGKLRHKFYTPQDEYLYEECYKLYYRLKRFKKQKTKLLNSILFFTISLKDDEDPERYPSKYIRFTQDYHERWCIENCFRDIKRNFLKNCRSRRSTTRQFMWILGLLLYNQWQTQRTSEILDLKRKQMYRVKPWEGNRPHIAKKFAEENNKKLSAGCYMIQTWETGLRMCLKNYLKT